ncbi:MAG: TlpA family protein disulfide reductase [Thermoleophilaceae bacterium]|nr:TlpA family protein disulfide reductase [Thermoleophilaceae bacterium]
MASKSKSSGTSRRWRGQALRGTAVLLLGLFLALLAWGLLAKAPDDRIDQALARGKPSPSPELRLPVLERGKLGPRLSRSLALALADGRVDIQELRGIPVVLNYWASWCVPCREEAPLLERSWREQRDRGVLFLGLNMQDITGDARAFLREFDVSYVNVRDPTDRTARRWGATGIPETFFISARGQVVGHVIGVVSPEQMRQGLLAARTGRALGLRRGGAQGATR